MLKSLHISNYALISSIDIDFASGLNIITGETGAGKSIMLGALGLILGARADTKSIRDISRKTVVEARFGISDFPVVNNLLRDSEYDVDIDTDECILRREITSRGGSRAFINDTPVNLQLLRSVALQLIDIHSQHQNLLLSDPDYQLSIIDSLAGISDLKSRYTVAYDKYRATLKQYTSLRDMLTRNRSEEEYLAFQLQQLEELKLMPGEQSDLEARRDKLSNITAIRDNVETALTALNSPVSVTSALGKSIEAISRLSDIYSESDSIVGRLETVRIEVRDILDTLSEYDSTLIADPVELQSIEERLSAIYSLQARHNVETVEQLIDIKTALRQKLDAIEGGDDKLLELEDKARQAKKDAVLIAREISARRRETARQFAEELCRRACPLGMNNLRCEIQLNTGKLTPTGIDVIDFMFAFNKNQPLMSVGKTASGGEISRVMLVVKSIVAEAMNLPTIIFDEVDTGVSGDIARRMGDVMLAISAKTQVITITHLPQIAARGVVHFKVFKSDDATSTTTYIKVLDRSERIAELAMMISGDPDNAHARNTAGELLDAGSNNLS